MADLESDDDVLSCSSGEEGLLSKVDINIIMH